MQKINEILKRNNISGSRYLKNGKCIIVDNNDRKVVIKPNKTNIYSYLLYRNFDNIPDIYIDSGYEISNYIEEINIPREQKMIDLINIISILHIKTTYYKKISEYNIDEIYNDIKNKISDIKNYYDKLIYDAETSNYMSPYQYLLARNISNVYKSIDYCINNIEKWKEKMNNTDKVRVCIIHNNLKLEHFINNKLISWDNSKIGLPIFDLYKLYINSYNEYDWNELLNIYNNKYKLKSDELLLLSILISIPIKPIISSVEIDSVISVNEILNYIKLTNNLISKRISEITI